jgi:N6-adenosine-specific RNA methylase IME4
MFDGLPDRRFRCILADPDWNFKSNSTANPGRNARRHYPCSSLEDIMRLPVERYATPQAALFLWVTGPFLVKGYHIPVMRSWGFEPTAMGFVWIKLNPNALPHFFTMKDIHTGPGFTTRKNAEYVVIGKRGASVRINAGVHEVIIAPRREHSRKPEEVFRRIERYCDGPRLELFGRQRRPGWEVRGDEINKFPDMVQRLPQVAAE